jgi:Flp pilus assembly protein TadD
MNLRRSLSALCIFSGCVAQAQHVACTAITAATPAPNAAAALYWSGNTKEAAARFAELLAAKPGDPELTEGSVRANIRLGDVASAAAQAQAAVAAHPDSAAAVTAEGEVLFRQGKINDAAKSFNKAVQLDPCYAVARYQVARVARAESMYGVAQAAVRTARALNQRDSDIQRAWLNTLPLAQRIAELKKFAPSNDEQVHALAEEIARLEKYEDPQNRHACALATPVESAKIAMSPIMLDAAHIDRWGLETTIDGKTARLLLDSGASGIVIGSAFANRAGLKRGETFLMSGIGDQHAQKSHVAYADNVKFGALEFRDCEVEVSDRRGIIGFDGLVGPDVFRNYLVSANFPDHRVELSPLPARPGSKPAGPTPDSAEEAPIAHPAQDRYIAPEMKDFTPVYRFGHDLLIETSVNKSALQLMLLDSGDGSMSLSPAAASSVTHTRIDNIDEFRGISGHVNKLQVGGDVDFRFGQMRAPIADIMVMDNTRLSDAIGTEVSGFIGTPALDGLVFQIDYRDGLVNFIYNKKKDPNRAKAPGTECSYCNPGYTK